VLKFKKYFRRQKVKQVTGVSKYFRVGFIVNQQLTYLLQASLHILHIWQNLSVQIPLLRTNKHFKATGPVVEILLNGINLTLM
jgi:hypothetical protein